MSKKIMLFSLLLLSTQTVSGQQTARRNALKINIPFKYAGFFEDRLAATLQYERSVGRRASISGGVSFFKLNYSGYSSVNVVTEIAALRLIAGYGPVSVPPSNPPNGEEYKQIAIWSQWRYYIAANKDTLEKSGFFIGLSLGYIKDGFISVYWPQLYGYKENRHTTGLGPIVGYREVIKNRLLVEVTPSLLYGPLFYHNQYITKRPGGALPNIKVDKKGITGAFIVAMDISFGFLF